MEKKIAALEEGQLKQTSDLKNFTESDNQLLKEVKALRSELAFIYQINGEKERRVFYGSD